MGEIDIDPYAPPGQHSRLANWSLSLGMLAVVLSVICIGPLIGIAAVVCGHKALARMKKSGDRTGKNQAIGGLVTGYFSIAMIPVIIALVILNFAVTRGCTASPTNTCINNMRQIDSAIQQWALENGKKDADAPDAVAIAAYIKGGVFPPCPLGSTYKLGETVGTTPVVTCAHPGHVLP